MEASLSKVVKPCLRGDIAPNYTLNFIVIKNNIVGPKC